MMIRIVFDDNTCDVIPDEMLQIGITCKKVKMFYRNSEKSWIIVGVDPVRQESDDGASFVGPERRNNGLPE
jgi:hypothetical protein